MNHVLKAADASAASQQDAYTNASLPVAPELVLALAAVANEGANGVRQTRRR